MSSSTPAIGVVGATGAVGTVTLELLERRGFDNVRVFASARSAGKQLGRFTVEEATPEALSAGDVDIFLFSVGASASRALVPHAVSGGAVAIDKSSAYRLDPNYPLVVPEVNADRATGSIIANPNCCTIPLTCVLKPLHEAVGLTRVRVATYQSVSGAGAQAMERLRNEPQSEHDLRMDWPFDGVEFEEEEKLRLETQKIMELPELPLQASCVRVPVMVGHAEAVWIETEDELTPEQAKAILGEAPSVRLEDFPSPGKAAGGDEVLVGRIRRDPTVDRGLALFLACDNLRKGAALNAIQIAELVLGSASGLLPESADVGMLGRFFGRLTGGNWRPPEDELRFAAASGFDTVQIRSDRPGELEDELGIGAAELGALFDDVGLEPVLEMLVRHDGEPGTLAGALRANLTAIEAIGFLRVHIHPVGPAEAAPLLPDDFAEALEVAEDAGLIFATEHNAPGHRLLVEPDAIESLLDAVPGLGLVWDVNHTPAEHVPRFLALRELFTLVHVSDTPLPETNHHLPLGRGTVDFSVLDGIEDVPFILEIGGLPHSGGPGFDTNDALLDSLARLRV